MTRVITKTYSIISENRVRAAYFLVAGCLVLAAFYGLNIYLAVTRSVALQKVEAETAAVENVVQKLDAEYVALSGKITPDMAVNYGLRETEASIFINRAVSLGRLSQSRSGI